MSHQEWADHPLFEKRNVEKKARQHSMALDKQYQTHSMWQLLASLTDFDSRRMSCSLQTMN